MNGTNVLAHSGLVTKSLVKRRVAAAIGNAQDRNGWSNEDAGAAMGVCGNTIINRKDVDDHGKQMTVFELVRSLPHDPEIAREILDLAGFTVQQKEPRKDTSDDRQKASAITRALFAVSVMLEDGVVEDEEIRERRKELEAGRDAFDDLLARIGPKKREGSA